MFYVKHYCLLRHDYSFAIFLKIQKQRCAIMIYMKYRFIYDINIIKSRKQYINNVRISECCTR